MMRLYFGLVAFWSLIASPPGEIAKRVAALRANPGRQVTADWLIPGKMRRPVCVGVHPHEIELSNG